MTSEELEAKLLDLTESFNNQHPEVIYQPAVVRKLIEDMRDCVYSLDNDNLKETYNSMALDLVQRYLTIRKEDGTITKQAFEIMWEEAAQILFMYLEQGNKVEDTYTCIMRFLTYISSSRAGQDPRLTCAPESMLECFEYCKKIVRFIGDKSTEEILKKRLHVFAFQDTMESANNGNRNAIKYNATLSLLKLIGNTDDYKFLDEKYTEGIPYETTEFGDLVAMQSSVQDTAEIAGGEEEKVERKRPRKLK